MQIELRKRAQKFIDQQPMNQKIRILKALSKLPDGDVKPLQGEDGFRLRIGDFRAVYDIEGNNIIVYDVGNRGDI